MHENHDDHAPIIATRRSREPQHEVRQPLSRLMLALGAGLAVAVLIAWWWTSRSSRDGLSTAAQSERSAPRISADVRPEDRIEQAPTPSALNADGTSAEAAQPPTAAVQAPNPSAPMSVQFDSPDPQVRIELRATRGASPPLTSKAGGVVAIAPGTYRVVATGARLETFEQDVKFDGNRSLVYTVELCAERKREREDLAGQVIEERACATTAQCQSMFNAMNEQAEQLVKDRAFRARRCAKWRPRAAPDGKWTLNTDCGGATLATICRIEIAEGACSFIEPRRSVRGSMCPRVGLK